jgi:Enoyl-(Acyl carrier protein) reductase
MLTRSRAEVAAERDAKVPLRGRMLTAWDVANAALFLASDEANFITGVALPYQTAVVGKSAVSAPGALVDDGYCSHSRRHSRRALGRFRFPVQLGHSRQATDTRLVIYDPRGGRRGPRSRRRRCSPSRASPQDGFR